MDAAQYASYLQGLGRQDENKQQRGETLRLYEAIRAKQFGATPSPQATSWIYDDDAQTRYMKEVIFDPIVRLLPQELQDKLRHVPVVVLPNRTVNGCVAKAPNGDPLIIIDSGLMSMVSFWFERFFEATWMAASKPISEVASYNAITYKFIVDYYRTQGIFAFPLPAAEKRPEHIKALAVTMTMATEIFILLHEIAHILLGHLESSPIGHFRMFPSADAVLDIYAHPWTAEYHADIVGYAKYTESWASHETFSKLVGSSNPLLPMQAPLLFFEYLALIEKNVPSSEAVPSHPPAPKRLRMLLGLIEQMGNLALTESTNFLLETIVDMPVVA